MSRLAAALALVAIAVALGPSAASGANRYSLAGGCYTVTASGGKPVAEQVRLKATALGRYMLYTKDGAFMTAEDDGSLSPAEEPSPGADFEVAPAGAAFTLTPQSTKTSVASVTFAPAEGCATFPEAPLN